MPLSFATPETGEPICPLHILAEDALDGWLADQPSRIGACVRSNGFTGAIGQALLICDDDGAPELALAGYGSEKARSRGRFHLAAAAAKLPKGTYEIASGLPDDHAETEALGWLLAGYRFDRYKSGPAAAAALIAPPAIDAGTVEAIGRGEALTRDLINTPASDMGPPDLEQAARDLAKQHGASVEVTTGDDLLTANLPMIHTVGRAADRAPRLIDLRWGDTGPSLTLVGKGVCFDTGGLNIKPASSMGLMKKDMGGSATVLGLAHMIMATDRNIRLRVLIPAVENSISDNAYRPQDILTSRKGLTVEINNTDAEGRLVLADALALADEEKPDQIISMATLTGAARVAVGPDLAPYFSDDPAFVTALENAAAKVADPVWRMPFHDPLRDDDRTGHCRSRQRAQGGFAGCITAALFLRRFVTESHYAHFDIYGWQPSDAPARAKGGVGQGSRALLAALDEMLDR